MKHTVRRLLAGLALTAATLTTASVADRLAPPPDTAWGAGITEDDTAWGTPPTNPDLGDESDTAVTTFDTAWG